MARWFQRPPSQLQEAGGLYTKSMRLTATAEQRGGGCDGDRGAASRLGFTRQKAAAAVLAGPRARVGSFIGRPQDLRVRARDAVRGKCRAVPWSDSSSSPSQAQGRG
jgi:hypothetical protein